MPGVIKITTDLGEVVQEMNFDGPRSIARIKDRWKKQYGKKYKEGNILIEILSVKHEIVEGIVTKIEKRPEAIYSNPQFNR
jgi:hypothetical protein